MQTYYHRPVVYMTIFVASPLKIFTFQCVSQLEALSSFRSIKSKAIGIDGLNPRFFEILLSKLMSYVTHVFNTVLTKSTFPDEW